MESARYSGVVDRYRARLPVAAGQHIVALSEGNTPFILLENLPKHAGVDAQIYVKFEGSNPTGSFKDRGMTMAVTQAKHERSRAIICASTGNTSASAAAYAARAGMTSFVLIPDGKISAGKLAQAIVHGAVVIQIAGNFDDGMRLVKEVSNQAPVTLVNSTNPFRLQGQKTAAFEIVDALGRAPDYHCLPVGNAGNISAYWIGYSEYAGIPTDADKFLDPRLRPAPAVTNSRPKMLGYQASGAAPFLRGGPVAKADTVATAIRIGNPQSWDQAWTASRDSKGWFDEFSDQDILAAQKLLAEHEGIFCEPASAVCVAGALRDLKQGRIEKGAIIACTLTGHGLKDVDAAIGGDLKVVKVPARLEEVRRVIDKGI